MRLPPALLVICLLAPAGSPQNRAKPAPNGIAYFQDFSEWDVISITDRRDTQSLKLILGNSVAVRAIAEHRTNPWPTGTVLAKVSWARNTDISGAILPGGFQQIAFMVKDKSRYASTAGWGWAQWNGTELKPFGDDANFAKSCIACHLPLRGNDYVFTVPVAGIQPTAEPRTLMTLGVGPEPGTMFLLFGDRTPRGELSFVTWSSQQHRSWTRAYVPTQVLSVKAVRVASGSKEEDWIKHLGVAVLP